MDIVDFVFLGKRLLFLCVFPFVGLTFDVYNTSEKVIKYLKYLIFALLIPLVFGYRFGLNHIDSILVLFLLALSYSAYSKKLPEVKKGRRAFLYTFLLFILLGIWWSFSNLIGITKKEKIYSSDAYRVYEYSDRGFSGGTAYTYELRSSTLIPFYEKSIQITKEVDSCMVKFDAPISFDECTHELSLIEEENGL